MANTSEDPRFIGGFIEDVVGGIGGVIEGAGCAMISILGGCADDDYEVVNYLPANAGGHSQLVAQAAIEQATIDRLAEMVSGAEQDRIY